MSMLFKRIKDWATSITAFRTGDVIPVDGPSGTAKMSKDDLLRVTAENALAGGVAPAFDPTKPNGDDGYAYHRDDPVIYNGKLYIFKIDKTSGAWNSNAVELADVNTAIVKYTVDLNEKVYWNNGSINSKGQLNEANTTALSTRAIPFDDNSELHFGPASSGMSWVWNIFAWDLEGKFLGKVDFATTTNAVKASYPTAKYFALSVSSITGVTPISVDNLQNIISFWAHPKAIRYTECGTKDFMNSVSREPQAFNVYGLDFTALTEEYTHDGKLLDSSGNEQNYSDYATKSYAVSNFDVGDKRLAADCLISNLNDTFSWVVFYHDSRMLKRLFCKYGQRERFELDVPKSTNRIKISYLKSLGEANLYEYKGHSATHLVQTLQNNSFFKKNIVWFGTSIPAAGDYNVNNANSYPLRVGVKLGAHVNNEAVGSSRAKGWAPELSNPFIDAAKCMGNTIVEKLSLINDMWTINDENQTVVNGPRNVWNVSAIPSITTYQAACEMRAKVLSYSYEIKLILKYLIKDASQRATFISSRIPQSLLATLEMEGLLDMSYQGDYDVFVFDHGHNDQIVTAEDGYTTRWDYRLIPDDSSDITNYIGAINLYMKTIYRYKPKAKVIIVSDYDQWGYNDAANHLIRMTCDVQKRMADRWHVAFLDVRSQIQFTPEKVLTQGWWNGSTSKWEETGFTWDDVNGTNAYIASYITYSSVQELKSKINPVQIDGVWYYEYYPRFIWLKDGQHPHSDASGKCLEFYATILASLFKGVGA